ncbi:MAG: outer membrane protein transport protein [Deltaproteobacteria bacterium]|nr:outer membrane protein transport protein [Deltaproteobacteria bacterium]
MKLGGLLIASSLVTAHVAHAGGLFLPGSGATSTSRAGAAVASVDDGEALSVNPAGLAKTTGWTITISTTFIRYFMEFQRRGTYDDSPDLDTGYEGTPYPLVENDPKPPLGIGKFQPIPVIAVVSDLMGKVCGLRLAVGLYAPSGYPFRDMSRGYKFPSAANPGDPEIAPPPTRYDILQQESKLLLPTIAASYRIFDKLDVGARFTAGSLQSKSVVAVWGTPVNVTESVNQDSLFTAEVKDGFIPAFGIGATYRPTPNIELGAVYNSPFIIRAKGTAQSVKAPGVSTNTSLGPVPDDMVSCATGGTFEKQKACISLELPQNATIGGRYKIIGENGALKGDVELNLNWENWGASCEHDENGALVDPDCTSPQQYKVVIDSGLYNNDVNGQPQTFSQPLEKNFLNYGLKDTFGVRLGGSWHMPLGEGLDPNQVVVRAGIAYDTKAARTGWLRANLDGAARTTFAVGGAYKAKKWQINAGGGFVYEGTNTNPGASADGSDCNPTGAAGTFGCAGNGQDRALDDRQGPDPTNPLLQPKFQTENPYNQGTFKSHYILFMLGFSTSF